MTVTNLNTFGAQIYSKSRTNWESGGTLGHIGAYWGIFGPEYLIEIILRNGGKWVKLDDWGKLGIWGFMG